MVIVYLSISLYLFSILLYIFCGFMFALVFLGQFGGKWKKWAKTERKRVKIGIFLKYWNGPRQRAGTVEPVIGKQREISFSNSVEIGKIGIFDLWSFWLYKDVQNHCGRVVFGEIEKIVKRRRISCSQALDFCNFSTKFW